MTTDGPVGSPEARPKRVRIELTEWSNRWHWTVWDDPIDYQSDRVEGVLVPWAIAEEDEVVAFTEVHALRRALLATMRRFTPHIAGMEVVVPLGLAATEAIMVEHDRFPNGGARRV